MYVHLHNFNLVRGGGSKREGRKVLDERREAHELSLVVLSLRSHLFELSLLGGLMTLP
jgi:hypothetical protein